MSKTRQELILRALTELKVAGPGKDPAAEDTQAVDDEIDPLFDDLAERSIFQWGDPDQIDDSAFIHVAKLLANSLAVAFGDEYDPNVKLLEEQNLRELKPVYLSGQPQQTEYF